MQAILLLLIVYRVAKCGMWEQCSSDACTSPRTQLLEVHCSISDLNNQRTNQLLSKGNNMYHKQLDIGSLP